MDALGFDSCVLGGESMGSVVAMLAAQAHPERIDGLVLCAPPPAVTDAPGRCGRAGNATSTGSAGGSSNLHARAGRRRPRGMAVDVFSKGSARQGHTVMRALYDAGPEAVPDLGRIQTPALVVIGGQDTITPPEVSQLVVDGLPNATAETVPDMGHFPTVTLPDHFVRAVEARFG